MIQCKDCEFCRIGPDGNIELKCHPFQNIKESECLVKWQLLKLDTMVRAYMITVAHYKKLAPMQEKMMKAMEREIDDLDEADKWKLTDDDLDAKGPEDDKDDDTPDVGGGDILKGL
jgi:hypothetical protein